jgi:hypothetical protein
MIALGVVLAFIVGLSLRLMSKRSIVSCAYACAMAPVFVLLQEFVMPYEGGGASMWPIALFTAGIAGAIFGAVGVGIGALIMRGSDDATGQ